MFYFEYIFLSCLKYISFKIYLIGEINKKKDYINFKTIYTYIYFIEIFM